MKRFLPLLLLACSTPPEPPQQTPVVTCANDERVKTYSAGLSASASDVVVTLVEADPAPPARGTNVWKVKVPSGSTLTVTAFMPDHGHGTSVTPQLLETGDGEWTISQLTLFMPGVWRVTFAVTKQGKVTEVPFFFCVAG